MLCKIRNYLSDQPIFFSFLRKIIELNFQKQKKIIGKALKEKRGKKVLDIGCGTGEFSSLFDANFYCGIDISPGYISYAEKNSKGEFKVMDATNIDFPDQSFDFILIMAVLHHLNDKKAKKVIREAARILKPDGKILIMEDAKIKKLENAVVRFIQKFDKGEFIRTPADYQKIITPYLKIIEESGFRNGGCIYHSMLLKK